jgi:hypothetical protein
MGYHHSPEDTTYAVLFSWIIFINYSNVIKIIRDVFEKITIMCFGANVNKP